VVLEGSCLGEVCSVMGVGFYQKTSKIDEKISKNIKNELKLMKNS